jgi:hypothetical protein
MDPEQPDPETHHHGALMSNQGADVAMDSVLQLVTTSIPEQVTAPTPNKDTSAPVRHALSLTVVSYIIVSLQALEAVLNFEAGAVLPALLVHLPKHGAAILRHAQLDPSCKLCSSSDDSDIGAEAATAVLHALVNMAQAASYGQLQELLLRLLQLAASKKQCRTVAEGAALAVNIMCYAAVQHPAGNLW